MERERPTLARRGILRGLASLPLVGGAAALAPTLVAEAHDPIFEFIARHRMASAAVEATLSTDPEWEATVEAESEAMYELAETVPQTLAGLRAFVQHFHDMYLRDGEMFDAQCAFPAIAEACLALIPAPSVEPRHG